MIFQSIFDLRPLKISIRREHRFFAFFGAQSQCDTSLLFCFCQNIQGLRIFLSYFLSFLAILCTKHSMSNLKTQAGGFGDFYTMKRSSDMGTQMALAQLLKSMEDEQLRSHEYN